MKNYYKRGIAPKESGFITGYRKSYDVDRLGNIYDILEVYTADGECEVSRYSPLLELNTLRWMRKQFECIDKDRLKGKHLREYEKVQFFLEHEDDINKALMSKTKKNSLTFNEAREEFEKMQEKKSSSNPNGEKETSEKVRFIDSKFVSHQTLETVARIPGLERSFAITYAAENDGHLRIVKNSELAERLGISLEELELIKSENPNKLMQDYSLLVSMDILDDEDIMLGLGTEGFDLYKYTKNDLISILTGKISEEEALKKGIKLLKEKEFADSLGITVEDLANVRNLQDSNQTLDIPLITMNDLDNYSLEDLKAILEESYAEEYNRLRDEVPEKTKPKRFLLQSIRDKVLGLNKKRQPKLY